MRATEIRALAAELGVPMEQIARDVLISHVLHATSAIVATAEATFFGGTALSRTHLRGVRLSEDVDLLADDPTSLGDRLDAELATRLRRLYPGLSR